MAYASVSDLLLRIDERRIRDLVNDDKTRATSDQVASSPKVALALEDASALLDSACQAGNKYTAEDLLALTGSALSLCKWIVCSLAYGLLVRRRGHNAPDLQTLAPQFYEGMSYLDQLKEGMRIFPIDKARSAGLPSRAELSRSSRSVMLTAASRYFGDLAPDHPGV